MTDFNNPYNSLPREAFWKTACAALSPFDIKSLWDPKFHLKKNNSFATYGSCFAQHIGQALKSAGYNWLVTEHRPIGMNDKGAKEYNYEVFTARTGNIYTATLLEQWVRWACEGVPNDLEIWDKNGRYFDPFRPVIEPNGFSSAEEVINTRNYSVKCFADSIKNADFFIYTLGLTERWLNNKTLVEYPMCPGTAAGTFDDELHSFDNLDYGTTLRSLFNAISMMRSMNPKLKFLLTVSPVPLTATYTGDHVLVATMRSKSILRAVASEVVKRRAYVDYFPSYEIINSPVFRGMFFEPNLRSVNPAGVKNVMNIFFSCLENKFGVEKEEKIKVGAEKVGLDEVCEEQILESFS